MTLFFRYLNFVKIQPIFTTLQVSKYIKNLGTEGIRAAAEYMPRI
jgi:hypothetical protein